MAGQFLGAALIAAALTLGAGDFAHAASGKDISLHGNNTGAAACSLCHGPEGQGQPQSGFPRLAGLDAGYIAHQLASFADGTRKNAIMEPIAKALSEKDRQAVASYFAGLKPPQAKGEEQPTPEIFAAGAELAQRGEWSKAVPACGQCHGPTGSGIGSAFPKLAGQSSIYIATQLENWKKGERRNDPMGLMAGVASKLDDNQIKAVAAYYASLPQVAKNIPTQTMPSTPKPAAAPKGTKPAAEPTAFTPPPESAIPNDQFGDMVRLGEAIFHDTQANAASFVGDKLQCSNCHLDRGRLAGSAPLWAAYVAYPAYRSKNKHVNTFEERLQGCFRFSMNGKMPPAGDKVLVALQTYAYFLAKGAPTGADMPGRGYPTVKKPAKPLDYAHGQQVYAQNCALCHGADGQGQSSADGKVVFPPLWGAHSFNWGAGMGSIKNAAAFVKANMPLGQGGKLSDQDAWDVATYIDSQERPQDPRFTGSVAETRKKYHDSPMSMYGQKVNGILLGEHSPPSGTVPSAK